VSALLARRYFAEYARNPLNLILLLVVPVVFVALSAGALAEFADLLGGSGGTEALEANTAGFAAAFLAGVAGYFQVSGSRQVDRRLALAGLGAVPVVAARLATGLGLAVLAATGAVLALAVRTGIPDPAQTLGATLMFAVIYLAIGALVGVLVRDPVNGAVVILFVWLLDVFLGPTMTGSDFVVMRFFPTHFVSLVMVDASSGHASPLSDLSVALLWTVGSLLAAGLVFAAAMRPARLERHASGTLERLTAGLRYGFREYRRNTVLWVLLVLGPVLFISVAIAATPDDPLPVRLSEGGRQFVRMLPENDLHGATMAAMTITFLAGLAGLFVVIGSAQADRRLALAGFRSREVLAARIALITAVTLLATGVALAVTARDFIPQQWLTFAGANLLVGLTYGFIGVVLGPLLGRVGGLYLIFLVIFVDVGIAQNVMFDAAPPAWAKFMPAYGASRVLVDGAFTPGFDETGALLLALAWLGAIALTALAVFHRVAEPERA
jgi:hypothetical protein